MHMHLYFAIASLVVSPALSAAQSDLAWQGDFRSLERQLAVGLDAAAGAADYPAQQSYADLQLLFGRYEEAEQLHRDALKTVDHDRERFQVLSCRNAAWQALFLQRHGAALACLRRVAESEHAGPGEQFQAWVGMALVTFQMGQLDAAWDCAQRVEAMAAAFEDARCMALATTLRRELALQLRLRGDETLADHVYWRSLAVDFRLPAGGPDALPPTGAGALARCCAFLDDLHALAEGGHHRVEAVNRYLQWASASGLPEYARFIRLDTALAALNGGLPDLARQMLDAFGEPGSSLPRGGHWYLDYLFCQADILRRLGRRVEGDAHYRRYCLLAMKRARESEAAMHTMMPMPVHRDQPAAGDDISARLVGKYRRAYAYLVEHLEQPDLSVKEIAAHIGVTERALQLAMRNSLGISPTQLIRRLRMERIHNELLSGDSKNVLAIATKWGVRHRSTLANAYRREFKESPSETMLRSAA